MTTESIQAEIDHLEQCRQEKLKELFLIEGNIQAFVHMLAQLKAAAEPKES